MSRLRPDRVARHTRPRRCDFPIRPRGQNPQGQPEKPAGLRLF